MSWPRRWRAGWIWRPAGAQFVFLRKTFEVSSAHRVRARASADGRYVLWCNGIELGRGPVRSDPSMLTYDPYELDIRRGHNVVCALVRHYGRPTLYWKPAQRAGELGTGGFLFETDASDGIDVATNATWRVADAPYRDTSTGAVEGPPDFECLEPGAMADWHCEGFDDSHWEHATELFRPGLGFADDHPPHEPFASLEPRPIPHLASLVRAPVSRTQSDGRSIFDFGGIVSGHVVVCSAGDAIVRAGEDVLDGDVVMDVRDWGMQKIGSGEMISFEPVGLRYLSVDGEVDRVEVVERSFPRPEGASFRCGNEELEAIWNAGARTLDLCSEDAYIDCPGRERRAWLSDAYLHSLVSFVCNPDTSLAKWNLRLHAQGARADGLLPMTAANDFSMRAVTIPDSSLHWVRALARAYEYTADVELVAELLPAAMRVLDYFERLRDERGLIADLEGWVFIDWAQTERGRNIAVIDALYALALDDTAFCAGAIGDTGSAARLRARADRTRESFAAYFDASRGLFVDALGGRAKSKRISQQTNSLAILSGAVTGSHAGAILDAITDDTRVVCTRTPADGGTLGERVGSQLMPLVGFDEERDIVEAQPFFAHFLHQALVSTGRMSDLVGSIMRWSRMLTTGNGCFEEYWRSAPGMGSRAHAWSATPTFDLTTHLAGIRPAEPGWSRILIEPKLDQLAWIASSVPTPYGWIHCSIRRDGSGSITTPVAGELRAGSRVQALEPGVNAIDPPEHGRPPANV